MPIRVAVLDDSAICRTRLREILEAEHDIVVVGEAENGSSVLELIRATDPRLLVVDLQMPGTGGHQTIERVMANHPLPILVVTSQPSGVSQASVFESIRRGALDLAEKPMHADVSAEKRLRSLVRELSRVPVVRHVAGNRQRAQNGSRPSSLPPRINGVGHVPVIGIGASAGGPLAVATLLGHLSTPFPAAVAVVQHLPSGFAGGFADFLRSRTPLPVTIVTRRTPIAAGTVYVAPDDLHLIAADSGAFSTSEEPEIEGHRPAVDVLFRSLASTFGRRASGVVMSGIGRDGTAGLLEMKRRGAFTLAQDQASSGVFGMPRSAVEAKAAELALDPVGLARAVSAWAMEMWKAAKQ